MVKTEEFSKDSGGFRDSCFSFSCLLSQLITVRKKNIRENEGVFKHALHSLLSTDKKKTNKKKTALLFNVVARFG